MEQEAKGQATHGRRRGFLSSRRGGQIAGVLFLLLCVYLFGFRGTRFFLVPSDSMADTLIEGDQLVTMRQSDYQRGDIIVLREHDAAGNPIDGEYLVKRIIGLGGDEVSARGGAIFIDGDYVSEPYVKEFPHYLINPPFEVPEGNVFVLGDNRNVSDDSHTRGETWPVEHIMGRVRFIYYPYDRFGPVASYPLDTAGIAELPEPAAPPD